jgi:hypothetical protein
MSLPAVVKGTVLTLSAAGLVLLGSAVAAAAGLEDSAGNGTGTVRTELYGGASAGEGCPGPDNQVLADCIYAAHLPEVSNKTSTQAYMVGLVFDGWLRATADPAVKKTHTAEGVARDFFVYLEQHRKEAGLTLQQVCEGARRSCDEAEPAWKEWNARLGKPRH